MKIKSTYLNHSLKGTFLYQILSGKKTLPLSVRFIAIILFGSLLFQGCDQDDDDGTIIPPEQNIDLQLIADNFVSPIGVVAVPDDSERLFVIDQIGTIWIIDQAGNKLSEPFLDVRDKMVALNPGYDERGLLGLDFHPNYSENGRFYVYYTAPPNSGGPGENGWNNLSRISEFTVSSSDPDQADPGSEKTILEVDQPQGNHEGGTIAFGPDGYLYIALGDGGGADDTGPGHVEDWYEVNEGGNAQNIEANLLGKILRLNVDAGSPYSIPSDNPFVGQDGMDEIFAYGFRNPFRFSFDMGGARELLAGDAGQVLWEEINVVVNGGNYGWNVMEATHCFDAEDNENVLAMCPDVDSYGNVLIDPVIEMVNSSNPIDAIHTTITIIGGNVYRGSAIPELQGQYIFGSFSHDRGPTGEIFVAVPTGVGLWLFEEIQLDGNPDDIGHFLKGFGQDLEGEIYVAASGNIGPEGTTGKIFKLVLSE